jgi:hypothetical protein
VYVCVWFSPSPAFRPLLRLASFCTGSPIEVLFWWITIPLYAFGSCYSSRTEKGIRSSLCLFTRESVYTPPLAISARLQLYPFPLPFYSLTSTCLHISHSPSTLPLLSPYIHTHIYIYNPPCPLPIVRRSISAPTVLYIPDPPRFIHSNPLLPTPLSRHKSP